MYLKKKLKTKQVWETILLLFSDAKESLWNPGGRLFSSQNQPMLLYQPRLSGVLLIHQGELIDLLISLKSSIILKSKEGCSITFQREGAFVVIQSEGLMMESK